MKISRIAAAVAEKYLSRFSTGEWDFDAQDDGEEAHPELFGDDEPVPLEVVPGDYSDLPEVNFDAPAPKIIPHR